VKKVVMFLRVPEQMKLELQAAAKAKGRTLNAEVTERLRPQEGWKR